MSHILLNYAFLFFWSIFGEIHRELLFLVKKWLSQKRALKYSESIFFLPCLKVANPEETLVCLNNCFRSNQWKWININKKCFSPQSEPHTAKQCLSVVLKHFWLNSQRTSLFIKKSDYLRNEHWYTQKICFSYHVWKNANPEENLGLFKQLFLIKPVKGDKY